MLLIGGILAGKMINIDPNLRTIWKHTNWPWTVDNLSQRVHDNQSDILFCGEIDDIFFFGQKINQTYCMSAFDSCSSWIGVAHQHKAYLNNIDFSDHIINQYIDKCKCLIVLSDYMKKYWESKFPNLKVLKLFHPCPERKNIFNFKDFLINPSIRSLGTWGRSHKIWGALDSPYRKQLSSKDKFLNAKEFDKIFINTIQFIDLEDASANNGVIECIRRNTPLLISKHPAVIEYLGENYPFYFSSLEEANIKINDTILIKETHDYLKSMDKKFISINYFIEKFKEMLND
jgi:hypothetical protein